MNERNLKIELVRFTAMTTTEKVAWLSNLLFVLSMLARETYEAGTHDVTEPARLRKFNELIHRVASFQRGLLLPTAHRMPDEVMFELLDLSFSSLNLSASAVLRLFWEP